MRFWIDAHLEVSPSELQLFLQVVEEFAAAIADHGGSSGGACVHHDAAKADVGDAEFLCNGRPEEGPQCLTVGTKLVRRLKQLRNGRCGVG